MMRKIKQLCVALLVGCLFVFSHIESTNAQTYNTLDQQPSVPISQDITCTNTGACTVTQIQDTPVSAPTGTGNVVLSNGPTFTGPVYFPSGRTGTFVCSASVSAITNSNVLATSNIIISMNTPAGTVSYPPNIKALTAGTSFTPVCATSDTSTYNYAILN